jgi:cytochrome c
VRHRHSVVRAGMTFTLFLSGMSLLLSSTPSGRAAESDRGKDLFEKRCSGCHSLDKDKEGPRLRDVYGRKSGAVQNFQYSDAVKSAHIIWDETTLDHWLDNSDQLIPGNDMAFRVVNPMERAEIVSYLKSLVLKREK